MKEKQGKWATFFDMLFMFLAISKIMYWFNTIFVAAQNGFGNVAEVIVVRLLNQDIMIIAGVLIFFGLEKIIDMQKAKFSKTIYNILLYVIGYILLMATFIAYIMIISFITAEPLGRQEIIRFLQYSLLWYLLIIVILNVKQYIKEKEKKMAETTPATYSNDEKISMLEVLLTDGILSQEEYDRKKEILQEQLK